jgi:hypothetical protein
MNRIPFLLALPSAVLLATVACTPTPPQADVIPTDIPAQVVAVEMPVAVPQPPPPDASRVAAGDSEDLLKQSGPVLEGIGRWAKARGARLPAQTDEVESLRAQTVHLEERARAIRQTTIDDTTISSHVRRAADANAQALNEVVITIDLVQQIFDMASKPQVTATDLSRAQTLMPLVEDHLKHASTLIGISVDELKAYKTETSS